MDALFVGINAKFIHTNNAIRLLKANSAFNTETIEFTIKDPLTHILKTIQEISPKIIGFSVYIWNVHIIESLIKSLKETSNTPIILGGPEVTYDTHHFLNNTAADIIVRGEGERTIDCVIEHLLNGTDITTHPNIALKKDNTIIENPIQEITDLTTIASPYYDPRDIPNHPKKIAYIETSRGCPYRCSYCLSSLEKKVRFFPLDTIKKDLLYLLNNNVKTFKFLDRTFNANKNMITIIDFIINNHKPDTVFQFEITGDILDETIIDYINTHAPKGLFRFEIGIQSIHPLTNLAVDRLQNNHKLFTNIKKIKQKDIITLHLDLIAGLPLEDLNAFKETFNTVYRLGAKELQLGFLKMLRGTKIRAEATRYNYTYNAQAPYEITAHNTLSEHDIKIIKDVEKTLNIFHNKGHFTSFISPLIINHFTPFTFFLELHDFINRHHGPLKNIQIDVLYSLLDAYLKSKNFNEDHLHNLKITYLKRAKVKPKLYFTKITDKTLKNKLYQTLATTTNYSLNTFYKHSIIIAHKNAYTIALYQNHKAHLFTIKNGL